MALQFDKLPVKRKNPIKRNSMFFSGEDFDVEMGFSREYMEHDANQTIILYQVDLSKTMVNDVYKEAKKSDIRFKTPIELTCIYDIQDADTKAYNDSISKGIYSKPGNLTFSVLLTELEEKNCTIKRGDYVGIDITETQREYWVINNDGKSQMISNKSTIFGKKPYYLTFTANYVDPVEFQG